VASRIGARRELYALVESVRGVLGMRGIAATPGVTRLAFGNIDFVVTAPDEVCFVRLLLIHSPPARTGLPLVSGG